MTKNTVLIAGGGIGGITAALCLAQQGFRVKVFEQANAFAEAGAGIQLSPNCTRVLHSMGLEDALRTKAFLPEGMQFRQWKSGKVISASPLGQDVIEQYGAPYYHIHRGDLLRILVEAAEAVDTISLCSNARVSTLQQAGDKVTVAVGSSLHEGDMLVGADGIHSQVRAWLWGDESPRFTGNIAWRALVPVERLPAGMVRPMSTAWWGPNKHFVHYYVRGGALVNCVCVVEKRGWEIESWTEAGDYAELKSDFAGWHPNLQELLNNADRNSLYKWALFDRTPLARWGQGRVTLLGDACHPTLPFMAQGAAMAIEDAAVLSGCLAALSSNIPNDLVRYENLRRERTADIQNESHRNARLFHLSGLKAWMRNHAVRAASKHVMDKLFSYNALEAAKD